MLLLRDDVCRARTTRRARASSGPAHFTGPAVTTFAAAVLAAVVLVVAGRPAGVVGGTVAAIAIIGAVAAHRTTASLFAGVALLLVRPFGPGEPVRLYSSEQRGFVEGVIVRVGLINTTLATDSGLLVVANRQLLRRPPEHSAV